jgi:ABC-type lipoprotein export system ATPase subunit
MVTRRQDGKGGTVPQTIATAAHTNGRYLIELHDVVKTFKTDAGDFTALKDIDLKVGKGEFVAVIGKSGSGKSTLINMITGIDRPTSGQVHVADADVQTLSEGEMAQWRGRTLGIIFQFFQLLPTLTVIENVMLPMDFARLYSSRERRERALALLDLVGVADQAGKLPTMISGGQQQRVAIARSLANDPAIIVADEPTGNLDSKTSEAVFELFERLVEEGKTVLMVTHDPDQAQRVTRTVVISDGEIIEEYLSRTFPALNERQLIDTTRHLEHAVYKPGEVIIQEGTPPDSFYLITKGEVEVLFQSSSGQEVVVTRMGVGQYFGEIELLRGGTSIATIRAVRESPVEVAALDHQTFNRLIADSEATRAEIDHVVQARMQEHKAGREAAG